MKIPNYHHNHHHNRQSVTLQAHNGKAPCGIIEATVAQPKQHAVNYTANNHNNHNHPNHPNQNQNQNQNQDQDHHKPQSAGSGSGNGGGCGGVSSGRPTRVKGPCQACHEASDGCMRKAFGWPFPASSVFKDKGKPFVYLCNKCGLRYNKSNGCVCRHCRWVFCKEEKRKAIQFIDQMRRSRPDGKVDPDEDIEGFVCVPKYWSCGQPWKVGWVLNEMGDQDEEDEDMS
ncbi:hypothetical protein F4703DRAFT_1823708 [Phycomyces blakesleeanus]